MQYLQFLCNVYTLFLCVLITYQNVKETFVIFVSSDLKAKRIIFQPERMDLINRSWGKSRHQFLYFD